MCVTDSTPPLHCIVTSLCVHHTTHYPTGRVVLPAVHVTIYATIYTLRRCLYTHNIHTIVRHNIHSTVICVYAHYTHRCVTHSSIVCALLILVQQANTGLPIALRTQIKYSHTWTNRRYSLAYEIRTSLLLEYWVDVPVLSFYLTLCKILFSLKFITLKNLEIKQKVKANKHQSFTPYP